MFRRISLLVLLAFIAGVTLSLDNADNDEDFDREEYIPIGFRNSEDYINEAEVPDSVGQKEINNFHSHPFLMLMPEESDGKLSKSKSYRMFILFESFLIIC